MVFAGQRVGARLPVRGLFSKGIMESFEFFPYLCKALMLSVILSAIPLGVSMVVGLITGILQAATQVQEQTLSFVPKVIAVCLVLYVYGYWMVGELVAFCHEVLMAIPELVGGGM